MTDDAFPKVTTDQLEGDTNHLFKTPAEAFAWMEAAADEIAKRTGKPKMTQDVTVLAQARKHLEAICDVSQPSAKRPTISDRIVIHADACSAIEILDSLRWLWDEVVPSAEWLATHPEA